MINYDANFFQDDVSTSQDEFDPERLREDMQYRRIFKHVRDNAFKIRPIASPYFIDIVPNDDRNQLYMLSIRPSERDGLDWVIDPVYHMKGNSD